MVFELDLRTVLLHLFLKSNSSNGHTFHTFQSAIYAVHRKPFGAADSKYSFFEIYSPDVLYAFFVVMALQAAFYYSHYRAIAWSRPSTRGHLLFDVRTLKLCRLS